MSRQERTPSFWQTHKLFFAGLGGLLGGAFMLFLVFGEMSHGLAMTFSRRLALFAQHDRPADFVASVLLHTSLSVASIVASIWAIGKYFYLPWTPSRRLVAAFFGFVGATFLLFSANVGPLVIIGFPVFMLLGFPLGLALGHIWPPDFAGGFLPPSDSDQLAAALSHIFGFLAWWVLLTFLANRRLYRLETE